MRSEDIKRIIYEIRNANVSDKNAYFRHKYPNFAKTHPRLFDAALDPAFDLTYLDMMLNYRDDIKKSNLNIDEADQVIYGKLREHYVDPLMPANSQNLIGQSNLN
jgi:hypothetical protein